MKLTIEKRIEPNILVVLDTNILVSAFWSKDSNPAKIVGMIIDKSIVPCYDFSIILEYSEVLARDKFRFNKLEVENIISFIKYEGISVRTKPLDVPFVDESDRKFYEVAKHCNARLITGNKKHFPIDDIVFTPANFIKHIQQ